MHNLNIRTQFFFWNASPQTTRETLREDFAGGTGGKKAPTTKTITSHFTIRIEMLSAWNSLHSVFYFAAPTRRTREEFERGEARLSRLVTGGAPPHAELQIRSGRELLALLIRKAPSLTEVLGRCHSPRLIIQSVLWRDTVCPRANQLWQMLQLCSPPPATALIFCVTNSF